MGGRAGDSERRIKERQRIEKGKNSHAKPPRRKEGHREAEKGRREGRHGDGETEGRRRHGNRKFGLLISRRFPE